MIRVEFEVSQTLRMAFVKIGGEISSRLSPAQRARLERAFEGAALDREVLLTVSKRAFQESGVALPGFAPEDLAAAFLAA